MSAALLCTPAQTGNAQDVEALLTVQIERKKSAEKRSRLAVKKCGSLEDKLEELKKLDRIASEIRQMRLKLFDAEDQIRLCVSTSSFQAFKPMEQLFPLAYAELKKQFAS